MIRGLFIMAPSLVLNPTLSRERIDAEIAEDPEAGRSEWLGRFREATSQYLEDDLIDAAIQPGRRELPFIPRPGYCAFVDSSGGRHDAFTMAIAHPELGKVAGADGTTLVLDRLLVAEPPFEPESVVQKFSEQVRAFGLNSVVGDRYAGEWVAGAFRKYRLSYESAELDKSAIYCEVLPLFTQHRVQLLDQPKLLSELRMLERRPRSGGKGDIVDHPPRSTDDAANAACGALWLASKHSVRALLRGDRPAPRRTITNYDEFTYYEGRR